MKYGINRVTLLGTLGNNPDSKNGVTKISVATNEQYKDKAGTTQKRTEWHNVVFFNKLAEVAAQYLKKGSNIFITGSLRTNEWTDKQGNKHKTTDIVASEMRLL